METIVRALFERAKTGELTEGIALLEAWRRDHPAEDTITKVLEPLLMLVGTEWQKQCLSLAQSYVATRLVESALTAVAAERAAGASALTRGVVVLGNVEDDFHGMGRGMVASMLRAGHWEVVDLGNDVPAEEFVNAAVESGAKVIGVSAMMYTTSLNIVKVRRSLDERGLSGRIKLAVGGAVFRLRPDLVAEVGGDGTCLNALGAPELFQRLFDAASRQEVGHA